MSLLNSAAGHLFTTEGQDLPDVFSNFKSQQGISLPTWLDRFADRVFGLIGFVQGQLAGPSGVHGQFLERNIESMTLKVSLPRHASETKKKIDDITEAALQTILTTLELQSRLHEELHHSLFYYLLMGHYEFVVFHPTLSTSVCYLHSYSVLHSHLYI